MHRKKPVLPCRTPRGTDEDGPRTVTVHRGPNELPPAGMRRGAFGGFHGSRGRGRANTNTYFRPAMKRARSVSSSEDSADENDANDSGAGSCASNESRESVAECIVGSDESSDEYQRENQPYSPPESDEEEVPAVVRKNAQVPDEDHKSSWPQAGGREAEDEEMDCSDEKVSEDEEKVSEDEDKDRENKPEDDKKEPDYGGYKPASDKKEGGDNEKGEDAENLHDEEEVLEEEVVLYDEEKELEDAEMEVQPPEKTAAGTPEGLKMALMTSGEKEGLLCQELRITPPNPKYAARSKTITLTSSRQTNDINIRGSATKPVYFDYEYTNHLHRPDDTVYFCHKPSMTSKGGHTSSGGQRRVTPEAQKWTKTPRQGLLHDPQSSVQGPSQSPKETFQRPAHKAARKLAQNTKPDQNQSRLVNTEQKMAQTPGPVQKPNQKIMQKLKPKPTQQTDQKLIPKTDQTQGSSRQVLVQKPDMKPVQVPNQKPPAKRMRESE